MRSVEGGIDAALQHGSGQAKLVSAHWGGMRSVLIVSVLMMCVLTRCVRIVSSRIVSVLMGGTPTIDRRA